MSPTRIRDASPFQGMDPYLEDTEVWPGFHLGLAEEIAAQLNTMIGPKYYAEVAVERLVSLQSETKLLAVHVYLAGTHQLVTTIEILSPVNKRRGEGFDEYRLKRLRLVNSSAHILELDLLRAGERPGPELLEPPIACDYLLLLNRFRGGKDRTSGIWPISLGEPLPLLWPDTDVILNLGSALAASYVRGGYGWRLAYSKPVPPPPVRQGVVEAVASVLGQARGASAT